MAPEKRRRGGLTAAARAMAAYGRHGSRETTRRPHGRRESRRHGSKKNNDGAASRVPQQPCCSWPQVVPIKHKATSASESMKGGRWVYPNKQERAAMPPAFACVNIWNLRTDRLSQDSTAAPHFAFASVAYQYQTTLTEKNTTRPLLGGGWVKRPLYPRDNGPNIAKIQGNGKPSAL